MYFNVQIHVLQKMTVHNQKRYPNKKLNNNMYLYCRKRSNQCHNQEIIIVKSKHISNIYNFFSERKLTSITPLVEKNRHVEFQSNFAWHTFAEPRRSFAAWHSERSELLMLLRLQGFGMILQILRCSMCRDPNLRM